MSIHTSTLDALQLTATTSPLPATPRHHHQLVAEPLVWQSPSGALLLAGRAMTHTRAIHACLTHTRNEIDPTQTTADQIACRTPDGSVRIYQGIRRDLADAIPDQRLHPREGEPS